MNALLEGVLFSSCPSNNSPTILALFAIFHIMESIGLYLRMDIGFYNSMGIIFAGVAEALMQDPCPFGSLEILAVSQMAAA